jgi:hypothetical protein
MDWLFTKKNQTVSTPLTPEQTVILDKVTPAKETTKKSVSVEEIHHSFLTAMDEILSSEKIISEQSIDDDLLNLHRFGFTQVKKIAKEKHKDTSKKITLSIIDRVKYYSQNYPQNKFITNEQLEKVCTSYGLVIGEPQDYLGDIPDRCIKEISRFKLMEADDLIMFGDLGSYRRSYYSGPRFVFENGKPVSKKYFLNELDSFIDKTTDETTKHRCRMLKDALSKNETAYVGDSFAHIGIHDTVGSSKNFMKIVAPVNMMDMKDKKLDGVRVVNEVKDPIVLVPVDGGNLIVSLWGAEAEIEELQNPNLN